MVRSCTVTSQNKPFIIMVLRPIMRMYRTCVIRTMPDTDSGMMADSILVRSLGAAFEGFVRELPEKRYAERTVRGYIWSVEHFVYWPNRQGVPIPSVDEACVDRFGHHLRHCRCGRRRRGHRVEQVHCARMSLDYLRSTGLVPIAIVESEGQALLVAFRSPKRSKERSRRATCPRRWGGAIVQFCCCLRGWGCALATWPSCASMTSIGKRPGFRSVENHAGKFGCP